jgi:hypothetical protein
MSSLLHVVARPGADLAPLSHGLILPPPSPLREGSSVSREQHLIHVLCVFRARGMVVVQSMTSASVVETQASSGA